MALSEYMCTKMYPGEHFDILEKKVVTHLANPTAHGLDLAKSHYARLFNMYLTTCVYTSRQEFSEGARAAAGNALNKYGYRIRNAEYNL